MQASDNILTYKGIELLNNDIYYNVLLNTDANDIEHLCQSNKQFHSLCNNEFWQAKIKLDYPL